MCVCVCLLIDLPETVWRANAEGSISVSECSLTLAALLPAAASDWMAGGTGMYSREPILELSLMNTISGRE